jgi:methylglutaconyl-CoA hydratase
VNAVRVERQGAIGRVVLARPERRNSLDREMAEEIFEAVGRLDSDSNVRIVHLLADGEDFCVGSDVAALGRMLDASPDEHRQDAEAFGRVVLGMRALMKPVVCSVHGRALSTGVGLALASDIVLAHADAEFGFTEVRIGFVPALLMPMLRRAVGEKRAADLVLTGRIIAAEEAEQVGLVSRVIPAAAFDADVDAVLAGLALLSPTSLALTKWLHYKLDALSFEDGIAAGVVTNVEARATEDFRDAIRRLTRPNA